MTINQSSLEAFELVRSELGKNQAKVLWAINILNKHNIPASDRQIASLLKWSINRVVPRRNELEKANRIYSSGRDFDGISQVKVNLWKIKGDIHGY